MRRFLLASLIAAVLGAGVGVSAALAVPADSRFALGVVLQVHRAAGAVTLMHEPVESLKWPAMKMKFTVARPELLDRLPEGRQVAIEFVTDGGSYRIINAIPLALASGKSASGSQRNDMHGDMMGDIARLKEMCMGILGGTQGGKRWWQFWK